MDIYLVKRSDNSFIAANNSDYESVLKLKVGETYKHVVTKPRNLKHHRKLFALFNLVYDNQERFKHLEDLRNELVKEAGYFEEYVTLQGELMRKAKSIAFNNMDQFEFDMLYSKVKDVVCIHFKITTEQIEEEIHRYY
jgi:hypothetical protein